MHLDSCRELKRSLRERATSLAVGTEVPWLAVGVERTAPHTYVLAVRVRDTASAQPLLARIAAEARDEVDVVEVGEIRALPEALSPEELQKSQRPLIPGCSVGHPDITAGTLGAFVVVDGAVHALSNNHVLGDSGKARPGDAALQPGVADRGLDPQDRFGELVAMSELSTERINLVDAAIARIDAGVGHDAERYPGGPVTTIDEGPTEDVTVEKIGRTTGHTRGRITAFEVDGLRINFSHGELLFDDQLEISGRDGAFSDGGDSGSLIWTSEGRAAVGLLFAGSRFGGPDGTGLTYANPITAVLDGFNARLAGA
ncbi:hypothetical protein CDO52_19665 [Nocardiopsis gilva YIM 90087]|uniref:Peptidase S1 domain-containing protein n=1 Tax=Nocardiopsis gilva YIM 90087 TaxID=1235441 RepID=A0A223S9G0_9ACTN|nr:hypothetical protein [Nocardiopsis gilva]ASU84722.1 hypothetical protein CDO52_19665 [Nocardiopsis gilva YIM 90087]